MFVKIDLEYKWYGKHTDEAFVGPFATQEAAESWEQGFKDLISTHKISGTTMIVPETNTRKVQFLPAYSVNEVYAQMYKALYEYCMG